MIKSDKKKELAEFIRLKGVVKTSEIIRWGTLNFYNRADRTKRDLVEEGYMRPLTKKEKEQQNYCGVEEIYKWLGKPNQIFKEDEKGQLTAF